MDQSPWAFHADCLRDGTITAPPGAHEIMLVMRDDFDLLGPGPGQVLRLVPGAVLYAEVDSAAGDKLADHLAGSRAISKFRFALGLMLGLAETDQIETEINGWIDGHIAVVLLPVTQGHAESPPAARYDGFLSGLRRPGP